MRRLLGLSKGSARGAAFTGIAVRQALLSAAGICAVATVAFLAAATTAAAACPNEALREEQNATFLPDCRAYEKVTPEDKNGRDIGSPAVAPQSTPSGDALLFPSLGAFAAPEGSGVPNYYIAERDSAGWGVRAVGPRRAPSASSLALSPAFLALSPDLSLGVVRTLTPLVPGAPEGSQSLYLEDMRTGSYRLVTTAGPAFPSEFYSPALAATSENFERVLFESYERLTPEASPGVNLYEWDGRELHLASVLPGDVPAPAGGTAGGRGALAGYLSREAMSRDGSRVIFTDTASGQIYLREGGESIKVSASQRDVADPNGVRRAEFMTATPDASMIFFSSSEKLTNDATTGPNDEGKDLYRYEVDTGKLTDLSVDRIEPESLGARVEGVIGVSTDGETVYFAAQGEKLTEDAVGNGEPGEVYVWSHGELRHVAKAGPKAALGNWLNKIQEGERRATLVSPNGGVMIFVSQEQLTSFDNGGLTELYRYSLATSEYKCISCGAEPTGHATLLPSTYVFPSSQHPIRNLIGEGDRIFFNSPDALSPRDTNGKQDVYEWEAPGTGSCVEGRLDYVASAGGCIDLISGGVGAKSSFFLDASADGSSAFFTTNEQLVVADRDDLSDLYVARTDGGYPGAAEEGTPCVGDACQGSASAQPALPRIGSATVNQQRKAAKRRKPCARRRNASKRRASKKKAHSSKVKARRCARRVQQKKHKRHSKRTKRNDEHRKGR